MNKRVIHHRIRANDYRVLPADIRGVFVWTHSLHRKRRAVKKETEVWFSYARSVPGGRESASARGLLIWERGAEGIIDSKIARAPIR
jgi:hypothetical protein